jgi:uncharacterized membrane protein HdeD (DUF308 family)
VKIDQEEFMATNTRSAAVIWGISISRILGVLVYIAAFFLPACREAVGPSGDAPEVFRGSRCAWMTLVNTFNHEIWHSKYFLAVFSGWINPLILLYLILLIIPAFVWPRRLAASLILCFIAGTWIFFSLIHLVPLVGHFLWIAGILMILAGEAFPQRKAASVAD